MHQNLQNSTGYLHRSLAIAEGLSKKYNLKNKLIFICMKNKLDRKVRKIIKNKNEGNFFKNKR